MRIRLVRRGDNEFTVMAEQASRKGKKVTAGRKVKKEELREETARLLAEVRPDVSAE